MALNFLNNGYFAGKVGIGTEGAVYQLTLGGNAVGSTEGLRINDPSNAAYGAHFSFSDTPNEVWIGGITNNTYNSAIGIHREATRSITIDVNNEVGIGVTGPNAKLHVLGSVILDGYNTSDPDSTSRTAYPAAQMFTHYTEANGVSIIGGAGGYSGASLTIGEETGRSSAFKFIRGVSDTNGGASAGEEFWVNGIGGAYFAGDVGIGTTSPGAKLTVKGSGLTSQDFFHIEDSGGVRMLEVTSDAAGNAGLQVKNTSGTTTSFMNSSGNSYLNGGNVGIGTTSPVAKLDVIGQGTGPSVFDYSYATDAGIRIHGDESAMDIVGTDSGNHASTILLRNGNEGFGLLNNPNLNTLQFRSFTASADGFAIHNTGSGLSSLVDIITLEKTGNVGIGTASPVQKLHLNNSATLTPTYQKFTNGTATTGTTLGIDSDGDFIINNGEAKEIKLYTSDVQRLTISSAGAVKFNSYNSTNNTGTPTYLLGTDGSGNIVKTNTVPGSAAGPYLPLTGGTLSGPGNLTVGGTTNLSSTLTVGADADGHDVLFYGNATGEKMIWDHNNSRLQINHDTDDSGFDVFTVSAASMTQPQLRVGRSSTQYWGVYTDDRNAHLVHRQDETTGTMTTRFDQWDSNTTDTNGEWLWRHGNGTGGAMTNALTLTQGGNATFAGSVKTTQIEIESAVPSILFDETDVTPNWRNRVQSGGYRVQYASDGTTFSDYFVLGASANTVEKDTTFAGNVLIGTNINSSIGLQVNQSLGSGNAIGFFRNSAASGGNGLAVDVTNTPNAYIADFRIGNVSKVRINSSGKITAGGGIDGLTLANGGINGVNYDIRGVNQLVISDPGEGIVFTGTAIMYLNAVDDATDSILQLRNATQLDLNSTARITNLVSPQNAQDAATKAYVDAEIGNIPSGLSFEGNWNASTDTPSLAGTTPGNGIFYIVSVAGSTSLSGITDWAVGDWAVFVSNGAGTDAWQKVDNSSTLSGFGDTNQVTYWTSTGNVAGDTNFLYDGTNLTVPRLRLGDGTDGEFYSDTAGRTAFKDGEFYIQSTVPNYYNYATNIFLGNTTGDTVHFRGSTITGTNWGITPAGAASFTTGAFTGNVGIGMAPSSTPLHVRTTSDLSDALVLEFAGTYQGGPYQTFQYNEGGSSPSEDGDLIGGIRARTTYASGTYAGYSTAIEFRNDGSPTSTSTPGGITFLTTAVNATTVSQRMRINNAGAIQFNAYGAGTLVTDASGNITASSGGGAGGPYLPLSAGPSYPLTGNLHIAKDAPTLILERTGGSNVDPSGTIVFKENSASEHFKINYDGANDRLEFQGLISSIMTDLVYIKRDTTTPLIVVGGAYFTGNVGIGVTGPESKLQIVADQNATDGGAKDYTGSAINADGGDIATGRMFWQGYQNGATDVCGINNETDRIILYNYTDQRYLQMWDHTGNSNIPSGYLGIGTTTVPTARITLADHTTAAGGIKFRSAATTVSLWSSGSGNLNTNGTFNAGSRIKLPGGNAVADPDFGFTNATAGTGFSLAGQDITFVTGGAEQMRITSAGHLGINSSNPPSLLDVQPTSANRKVTRIANDVMSTYFYNAQVDAILAWTCGSYHQSEVVITANQTNGGTYNNLYIRGIWSNNHTSHHWDELEHVGSLTGSTFTMSVGQNGATTASGRLELDFNYINGSFSQLNVRVTDFYGSHAYTIT